MMHASGVGLPALDTQAVQWSTTLGVLDSAAELVGCTPLQQATAVAGYMRAQGLTTSFTPEGGTSSAELRVLTVS